MLSIILEYTIAILELDDYILDFIITYLRENHPLFLYKISNLVIRSALLNTYKYEIVVAEDNFTYNIELLVIFYIYFVLIIVFFLSAVMVKFFETSSEREEKKVNCCKIRKRKRAKTHRVKGSFLIREITFHRQQIAKHKARIAFLRKKWLQNAVRERNKNFFRQKKNF